MVNCNYLSYMAIVRKSFHPHTIIGNCSRIVIRRQVRTHGCERLR